MRAPRRPEVEARFPVASPREFRHRVQRAAGRLRARYAFVDTVLRPSTEGLPEAGTLRIRRYWRPQSDCGLLLSSVPTRPVGGPNARSQLPSRKVRLYRGSPRDCLRMARALGFQPAFQVHHIRGEVWRLPGGVEVVLERIRGRMGKRRLELGWWAEVAATGNGLRDARRRLRGAVQRLGLDLRAAVASLPEVVSRALRAGGEGVGSVEPARSTPRRRNRL